MNEITRSPRKLVVAVYKIAHDYFYYLPIGKQIKSDLHQHEGGKMPVRHLTFLRWTLSSTSIRPKFQRASSQIIARVRYVLMWLRPTPTPARKIAAPLGLALVVVGATLAAALGLAPAFLAHAFTVTSLTPTAGPLAGGDQVTITGTDIIPPTPATPTTMQEMSQEYCASMPVYPADGSTITLTDSRGGITQTYQIRKLQDNNCWMVNNLKLGSTSATTDLTPADTHITNNWTLPQVSTSGSSSYNTPYAFGPVPGDGSGANNYGYLYNWCAATAGGTASGGSNTCTTQFTQPSNATGDICPANWWIPTSTTYPNGEFNQLNIAMYGNASLTTATNYQDSYHAANWHYSGAFQGVYSGYWGNGFSLYGSYVYMWSSSAYPSSSANAGSVRFNSSNVNLFVNGSRDRGFNVRCMTAGGTPPTYTVTFGGVPATNISVVDNGDGTHALTATTPAHAAGAVDVVISNGVNLPLTLPAAYTYHAPMAITALSPNFGTPDGGTSVTLTGTDIIPPNSAAPTVKFDGEEATVSSYTSTQIVVTTPAHAAGTVDVLISNGTDPDVTLPAAYTYRPVLTITELTPAHGPPAGGTSVTLTGSNILLADLTPPSVKFGGLLAPTVAVAPNPDGSQTITATTPAHAAAIVDVVISNGLDEVTLTAAYTYHEPMAITTLTPNSGWITGGETVTLTGSGIIPPDLTTPSVTFGDEAATNVSVTDNPDGSQTITATTPAHAAAVVDVVIENGLDKVTLTAGYTYHGPMAITTLAPNHGPPAGGTVVTITGTDIIPPQLPPPTTMQEMTLDYCTSMPVYPASGSTITLTDTRNNQQYMVRKLPDNNCWMVNNLKLGSTSGTTALTPADTNITANWTLPRVLATGTPSYTTAYTYGPLSATNASNNENYNVTSLTSDHFGGYLYNWCAATAGGTASGGSDTCTAETAQPSNATGDICPANWRLPTGGNTGELAWLNAKMNDPNATSPSTALSYYANWQNTGAFQGVLAGYYYTSGFGGQGAYAYLWSSSAYSGNANGAHDVDFGTGSVYPANNSYRSAGYAVRCLSYMPFTPTVTFGGVPATNVSVVDNGNGTHTLTATTPTGTAGVVDVVVGNSVDPDVILEDGYTYREPMAITALTPKIGLTSGGETVTITGTDIIPPDLTAPTVKFGDEQAVVSSYTDTQIVVTTPAHSAGAVEVVISNGSDPDVTLTAGYTYRAPMAITDITPAFGPPAGGTVVTLTGTNIIPPVPSAPTTMQEMTQAYCASMPVYDKNNPTSEQSLASTITLTDTRNGQAYRIRKLQDNNCWMVNNLRIALSDVAADPSGSDPKLDSTALAFLDAQTSPDNSISTSYYNQPRYYDPTCGEPSAPTKCGSTDITSSTFYGYLYNWCAAMGATTASCKASGTYPTDLAGNSANGSNYDPLNTASICPTNWRMPTGGATGESAVLNGSMYNNALSAADTTTDAAHAANWLYSGAFQGVLSGYFFVQQELYGRWWSSSAYLSDSRAYGFYFNSSNVYLSTYSDRDYGLAVRCLAPGGTYTAPTPTVTFGGVPATNVSVVDNGDGTHTLTATTPVGTAGAVDVVVGNSVDPAVTLEDAYTYQEPIYISLSITSSTGAATDSANLAGPPNLLLTDYITATTKTNNPTGYTLDISATDPRLKCAASNDYFEPLAGAGAITENHWGYATSSGSLSVPTSWHPVTTTPTVFQTSGTAPDQTLGETTTLHFAARANYFLPVCTYSGVVTVTAVAGV